MGLQGLPIGESDFATIIRSHQLFIDKSARLIPAFITAAEISIVYYPRRFGKTLAGSELATFFDCNEAATSAQLFQNLAITQYESGAYLQYRGRFPVIRFTFNTVSANSFDEFKESFAHNIEELYGKHAYLLESPHLRENVKNMLKKTMDEIKSLSATELKMSLKVLIQSLYQHHFPTAAAKTQQIGQLSAGVMVFIDEYDAPLQHSILQHLRGDPGSSMTASAAEYTKIAGFLNEVFKLAMKDNPDVCKAFFTGVLAVARESLFSGMNNATPYDMADEQYAGCFGFEHADVEALANKLTITPEERTRHLTTLREWYNGYTVGSGSHRQVIYNPWSVLNYLADLPEIPSPYWLNTTNNELIKYLLARAPQEVHHHIVTLLSGQSIEVPVQEHMTFDDIQQCSASLWGLLLKSGYVKVEKKILASPYPCYILAIPNREIKRIFHTSFLEWSHVQAAASPSKHALLPLPEATLPPTKKPRLDNTEEVKPVLGGQWENHRYTFEQHTTRGDGSCGFYALPIANDRVGAAEQLTRNAHRREIRVLLAPEIRAAIIENTLPPRYAK